MKKYLLLAFLSILFLAACAPTIQENTSACNVADNNLKEAIKNQLGIDGVIDCPELLSLRVLDSKHNRQTGLDKMIVSLEGLQYATNLRELVLASNQIEDISQLANLTSLKTLNLEFNRIEDISALSNLRNIETLFINDNHISDISSLSLMRGLVETNIGYNDIKDISALAGLIKLRKIAMIDNLVSDISIFQDQLGFSRGDGYLLILNNCLDVGAESDDMAVLNSLSGMGIYLQYEPQKASCQ